MRQLEPDNPHWMETPVRSILHVQEVAAPQATVIMPESREPSFYEEKLRQYPDDLEARASLVLSLQARGRRGEALEQILWMIENHPEAPHASAFSMKLPASEFARAREAWETQINHHAAEPRVLSNAASFYRSNDPLRTEELLKKAIALAPDGSRPYVNNLCALYVMHLAPDHMLKNPAFEEHARREVEAAPDSEVARCVARSLAESRPGVTTVIFQEKGLVREAGTAVDDKLIVNKPAPIYPPLAMQARIQGTVRFSVTITDDGRVTDVKLLSGHPLLVQAAKEAVAQYRFQPGHAAESVVVEVPFRLP